MKQTAFVSTGFELVTKRIRLRKLLEEMNLVVSWTQLVTRTSDGWWTRQRELARERETRKAQGQYPS